MKKLQLCFCLALLTALLTVPLVCQAETVVASGNCGDTIHHSFEEYPLNWSLTDDGVFHITGYGRMRSYEIDERPWHPYIRQIKKLICDDGLESVSAYAFKDAVNLTEIRFPEHEVPEKKKLLRG